MFSGVRQNHVFYVLEKDTEPKLRIGQVMAVSNPQPVFPYNQEQYVDITVKVDDETLEFKKLPAQASIADSGGIVVSDDADILTKEVESMLQASLNLLDRTDYHKSVVKNCNDILLALNPKLAKEKERDDEITNLKSKIGGLEDKMDQIITILSKNK